MKFAEMMQDGKYVSQFEVPSMTASSSFGEVNHTSSSSVNTLALEGNACNFFQSTPNHSSSLSMTSASDSWSKDSVRLSILTGSGSQHTSNYPPGHAEGASNARTGQADGVQVIERETKVSTSPSTPSSNSGTCSSLLKEQDYIGLSSDPSSFSLQGANFPGRFRDEKCAGKDFDLASKDTELRLGLGPPGVFEGTLELTNGGRSHVEGRQDVPAGSVPGGSRLSCLETSLQGTIRGSSLRDDALERENSTIECKSGVVSERINISSQHGATRTTPNQDARQSWNGEYHALLSHCTPFSATNAAEKQHAFAQEKGHSKMGSTHNSQLQDTHRHSSVVSVAASGHAALGVYDHRAPETKMLSGAMDFRFSTQDLRVGTEKSPCDSSAAQKFWQAQISRSMEGFRGPGNQDSSAPAPSELEAGRPGFQVATNGFAVSRVVIPVAKNTIPAKRGYMEAIGAAMEPRSAFALDGRDQRAGVMGGAPGYPHGGFNPSSFAVMSVDGDMKVGIPQVTKQNPAAAVPYPWANGIQLRSGWQMGLEQAKSVLSSSSTPLPPVGTIASQSKGPTGNAPAAEAVSCPVDAQAKMPSAPTGQVTNDKQHGSVAVEDVGASSARAPVVGWPPIRSFRKSTLQAAQPKPSVEEKDMGARSSDVTESGQQGPGTMYVKANMDGVPVGRKLDLKSYDSYESLKLALEDMFQRSINSHNGGQSSLVIDNSSHKEVKQLNFLHDSEYVLTHEDKDGDWMLVGDVPWEMFVNTVKRLRITKRSDAIGLGQRVSSKLKGQGDN